MQRVFLSAAALGCLVLPAAAQEPRVVPGAGTQVRAVGEATVKAKPDRAILGIAVITQAASAEAAAAENAKRTDAVLKAVRDAAGSKGAVETSGYALYPNYRYPRDGGQPSIAGYTASNSVEVTLHDLTRVGAVIDTATKAGANNISRLEFGLQDEQAARAEALGAAARKARANAESMAAALGMKMARVVSVEEAEPAVIHPIRQRAMAMAQDVEARAPTPVEPGEIEVRAVVTVILEAVPR